ncbi:MAG: substrate-binding domain-containing protein [Tissierellia bacterium]|nr:substrate-binding domain-containing protein [Tissierellia bacterium]
MRKKVPKYIQLAEEFKERIAKEGLEKGDKFYTEHALSQMYSVSRQTVRRAINILVNQQILESRQGSGTYVATPTHVQRPKTKTIGVIITYFGEYIFPSIINGIESVISSRGYKMQLASTRNDVENEARALKSMLDAGVDAFIIEPTKSALPNGNMYLYNEISNKNIPLIFLNSYYPGMDFPYIALDDVKAGYLATKYLIENGHKKIALCLKSDDMQGHLRYKGAMAAAHDNNVTISMKNVMWFTTEDIKYFEEDRNRILRYINNCTALFCYNDQIAAKVLKILQEEGCNIPEDYSIVSIDDEKQAALCSPALTTVAHPKKLLGIKIAESIFHLLAGEKCNTIKFEPELVVRDSVKRIL